MITKGAALALIACGIALRVGFLSTDSLWLDEAFSVQLITDTSFSALWAGADAPRHPPLYYVVLKGVAGLLGTNETAVRLPSAVASLCNLGLVFVLARRLSLSRATALTSVILLALSPIDIWYAREARMYELATTAVLMAAIALTFRGVGGAACLAVSLAVALWLDFSTIPAVVMLLALWAAYWWTTGREASALLLRSGAVLLACVAVGPLWSQIGELVTSLHTVTLFAWVDRAYPGVSVNGALVVAALVVEFIGVLAAAGVARKIAADPRMVARWPAIAGTAFAVANAALVLPRAFSAKQVLVIAWPVAVVLVAWSLTHSRLAQRVVVLASLVASVLSLTVHRADWRGVVAHVNQHAVPGTQVLLDPSWNSIPYDYYRPLFSANETVTLPGEIWLVAERYGRRPPTSPSEARLDTDARLVDVVHFSRLDLKRYRR